MPDLTVRNVAKNIIKRLRSIVIDEKKDKFVLYTNGMGGQLVKEYLEMEFSIEPEYIIDNKIYDGITVLNIEQAQRRNNKDIYFLICSWHEEYYDEIREKIYRIFPKEQIIDLFPKTVTTLPTTADICRVLSYIDTYLKVEEK